MSMKKMKVENLRLDPYSQLLLKVHMHRKFRIRFLAKIETSAFPMHEYHIIFVLTGEKGVEISVCFEALGANFDSHCVMS